MATWDDIKRLAADFQRAQLDVTVQRLTEGNCVEIIKTLIERKALDVLYTCDGKEYLTPSELEKEIIEELQVKGGRINLVDLQHTINVDFSHVETAAKKIAQKEPTIQIILGQLIDDVYLDTIAEEIDDHLQDKGQITVSELTKTYELPGEYISDLIQSQLKRKIFGQFDEANKNVLFTQAFVDQHRAQIRGALSACTRPVVIQSLVSKMNLQERLCRFVIQELLASGRLAGALQGGHNFVPAVYTRAQKEWVLKFYKENNYLEYDALQRLGIGDAKSYIRSQVHAKDLHFLPTCCVGQVIVDELLSQMEEGLSTNSYIDMKLLVPPIFTPKDVEQMLNHLLKGRPEQVLSDMVIVDQSFVTKCLQLFGPVMNEKAEADVRENPSLLLAQDKFAKAQSQDSFKDEKNNVRRAKGGSKSGIGGREVKTKATKKKYLKGGGDREDSDDETGKGAGYTGEIKFMNPDEIEEKLKTFEHLKECPGELITGVAQQLCRPLQKQYQQVIKSVFLQSVGGGSISSRRKTHGELVDKLNGLWSSARIVEKGLPVFPDDLQLFLAKHLLRSTCTDMTNMVFTTVAADNMINVADDKAVSAEVRTKILSKIPEGQAKAFLGKLHNSIAGQSLEDFFTHFEDCCSSSVLDVSLKKSDKKKDRNMLFTNRMALIEQIQQEADPALALHLAVTLLCNTYLNCQLHAPGKCVPQVLDFLKKVLTVEQYQTLKSLEEIIIDMVKNHDTEATSERVQELSQLLPKVKAIATAKKSTSLQDQDSAVSEMN